MTKESYEYPEEFEELMLDMMDRVDNGVDTEKSIYEFVVNECGYDAEMVENWLDEYHLDDFMRD